MSSASSQRMSFGNTGGPKESHVMYRKRCIPPIPPPPGKWANQEWGARGCVKPLEEKRCPRVYFDCAKNTPGQFGMLGRWKSDRGRIIAYRWEEKRGITLQVFFGTLNFEKQSVFTLPIPGGMGHFGIFLPFSVKLHE